MIIPRSNLDPFSANQRPSVSNLSSLVTPHSVSYSASQIAIWKHHAMASLLGAVFLADNGDGSICLLQQQWMYDGYEYGSLMSIYTRGTPSRR